MGNVSLDVVGMGRGSWEGRGWTNLEIKLEISAGQNRMYVLLLKHARTFILF
jgi:hypothetical protein